ncbi:patched domain-containing protein 3-like [Megalops cyprinoides]|uniref:patched domain-containing protein 3-like n=1 Tax=Megalops cyprinoides TaxID=118141 RepID=UPI0018640079|nr:patched domain-containing protein 3-like [Megalops cyprinoides]
MACCHTDCIEKPLSKLFKKFGRLVGSHPCWFLIVPMLVSAALGSGFYFLKDREANDIEEQFTPLNGLAKQERQFVKENFPYDESTFSIQRLYTEGTYASLIAVSKNGGNILTKAAFEEIIYLDEKIRNISVSAKSFANICAQANDVCVSNAILQIIDNNATKISEINITFPRHGDYFLGSTVGGVKVNRDDIVEQARAIRLFYYLREDEEDRQNVDLWLNEFLNVSSKIVTMNSIEVSYFTSRSRQEELEGNTKEVIPLFSVTYFLAITFSIVSCMRLDNVRNKVWVAAFGVLSAGLAVLSSFGMMLYIGVPFAMTVANAPFLILGVGIDDMFIMISAWQQTNVHDKVEQRLADTYKEAAVSITITTLTDVLAFYIGLMTPFGSVQSFCLYTGTALLFCYLYNITFFGAFMALNGRREASNRHWLTCMKIPVERPQESSKGHSVCCVGGAYDRETHKEEEQPMNHFFKKYYGPFLTKAWTKGFVVLLYAAYLAGSIYGCFQIQEGIDLKNLAADDSYVVKYYEHEKEYFNRYGPNVMVIVDGEFSYWNQNERENLNVSLKNFENLEFIDKTLFVSWLELYEICARDKFNMSNETEFKANLITFLNVSGFNQDVNFTNDKIYASRFFIQTVNITDATKEKNMLNKLRETAAKSSLQNASLMVYHPAFIYYDQYAVIVSNTIQNVVVATAAMLVISLLLIPNPLCSLWVTFAIASVIVGVAGFMALWDVNLDSISMINLVICIGFSVDFSAHISYAFVSNSKPSANEKAVEALFSLGYPIVQGAVSTILGVVVLSASKSYIFRTFFKIMFLVILFGAVHGIVFIPVFLTFFGICSKSGKVNSEEKHMDAEQKEEGIIKNHYIYENRICEILLNL